FSSRRRHTRCLSDWSSDVCSSDLVNLRAGHRELLSNVGWLVGPGDRIAVVGANGAGKTTLVRVLAGTREPDGGQVVRGSAVRPRSEERRVGKEWRGQRAPAAERVT